MSRYLAAAASLAATLPYTAQAHQGDHGHAAPTHALTSTDHLSVLVLLAVVVALVTLLWARR